MSEIAEAVNILRRGGLVAFPTETVFETSQRKLIRPHAPDGLSAYRFQDDEPFQVDLPEGNLFEVPAGSYGPSVTDGYFLMLAPLSRGRHTIHFRSVTDGVVQDVTYHLTVAPGK